MGNESGITFLQKKIGRIVEPTISTGACSVWGESTPAFVVKTATSCRFCGADAFAKHKVTQEWICRECYTEIVGRPPTENDFR